MCSDQSDWALPQPGFPIRTSPIQCLLDSSSRHFAACHVLHRLLTPRHPPSTLCSLDCIEYFDFCARYAVLKEHACRHAGTFEIASAISCAFPASFEVGATQRTGVSEGNLHSERWPPAIFRTPSRLNSVSEFLLPKANQYVSIRKCAPSAIPQRASDVE